MNCIIIMSTNGYTIDRGSDLRYSRHDYKIYLVG